MAVKFEYLLRLEAKIDRYAIYVFDYGAPTGFRPILNESRLSFHRTGMPMMKDLATIGDFQDVIARANFSFL